MTKLTRACRVFSSCSFLVPTNLCMWLTQVVLMLLLLPGERLECSDVNRHGIFTGFILSLVCILRAAPVWPLPLPSHFLLTSFSLPSHFLLTSFPLPSHFLPTSFPLPSHFLPTSFPLPSHFLRSSSAVIFSVTYLLCVTPPRNAPFVVCVSPLVCVFTHWSVCSPTSLCVHPLVCVFTH